MSHATQLRIPHKGMTKLKKTWLKFVLFGTILASIPGWFAKLGGARANREEGIQELTLTPESGRFLKPFAKLLLVIAAQRGRDAVTAHRLLSELHQEFPDNPLYGDELNKLDSRSEEPTNSNGTDN